MIKASIAFSLLTCLSNRTATFPLLPAFSLVCPLESPIVRSPNSSGSIVFSMSNSKPVAEFCWGRHPPVVLDGSPVLQSVSLPCLLADFKGALLPFVIPLFSPPPYRPAGQLLSLKAAKFHSFRQSSSRQASIKTAPPSPPFLPPNFVTSEYLNSGGFGTFIRLFPCRSRFLSRFRQERPERRQGSIILQLRFPSLAPPVVCSAFSQVRWLNIPGSRPSPCPPNLRDLPYSSAFLPLHTTAPPFPAEVSRLARLVRDGLEPRYTPFSAPSDSIFASIPLPFGLCPFPARSLFFFLLSGFLSRSFLV